MIPFYCLTASANTPSLTIGLSQYLANVDVLDHPAVFIIVGRGMFAALAFVVEAHLVLCGVKRLMSRPAFTSVALIHRAMVCCDAALKGGWVVRKSLVTSPLTGLTLFKYSVINSIKQSLLSGAYARIVNSFNWYPGGVCFNKSS